MSVSTLADADVPCLCHAALQYLYSDACEVSQMETAAELVRLADFLLLNRLRQIAEEHLVSGVRAASSSARSPCSSTADPCVAVLASQVLT